MTLDHVWHPEAVAPDALVALRKLFESPLLSDSYLAGGTGLALSIGHRESVDLDFFSDTPIPVHHLAGMVLEKFVDASVDVQSHGTLHAQAKGTRISFFEYPYPLLRPVQLFGNVRIADPVDIGCMKLSAIASRGSRRDFFDLYVIARGRGLPRLLDLFDRKYSKIRYSRLQLLKSLVYFEDAEADPMPQALVDFNWNQVKQFFIDEVPRCL